MGCHTNPSAQITNDRQAAETRHDPGTPPHGSGARALIRARLAVHSRTRPDSARHIEDRLATVLVLVMDLSAGWRVKDSTLEGISRRIYSPLHTDTDDRA